MSIGREFGQHEPLTTRLHNLVRSYPKGLGILKEFIQNADDAEADEIVFVIDEKNYDTVDLPDTMQWLHRTPALLVYNNKSFSDDDLKGIQSIGESGKSSSVGKTGRFGLGFNACYNVTDVPCFFTRNQLFFFDPHLNTVPEASERSPGRGFGADELIEAGWPLLDAFSPFRRDGDEFSGTVFRLPFRMTQQVSASKIKHEAYTVDDALKAIRELQEMGAAMLLFLKHVKRLQIEHQKHDGSRETLLSIHATNDQKIAESRTDVNALLSSSDPEHILATLKQGNVFSSCRHEYSVEVNGTQRIEIWRVVDGFFSDTKGTVINACQQMIDNEEKALPYAGAAWPLDSEQPPEGRIFCFLPVPVQTSMPAQINGYFDLDDSRQNMFLDEKTSGRDRRRFEWNKALLENSVAQAYVQLLEDLRFDFDTDKTNVYYSAFPKAADNESSWEGWLTSAFYEYAVDAELFRCSGDTAWHKLANTRSLPLSLSSVGAALIAENFLPIPAPALPSHVREGFKVNGITIPLLTPSELRHQLKEQHDVNCPIAEAPRECLRQRKYVVTIFRFCLSDKSEEDINGLPLVIDCRNHLRTIGITPLLLQGTEWDRDVFWDRPNWFIDPEFAKEAQLSSMAKANLLYMDNRLFVSRLAKYVSAQSANEKIKLNEAKEGSLTDTWLIAVFKRLLENSLNGLGEELNKIPLIPDQARILHSMGSSATPLLFRGSPELRRALTEIDVPLVYGVSNELRALLDKFSEQYDCIWPVTPRDLIDTLSDQRIDALRAYNSFTEVQHALLDYLSKDSSLTELKKYQDRHRKLKSLKIFPTAKGGLVDLNETAYVSQDFAFPPVDLDVVLLNDGTRHQWRELYLLLGVSELSRSHLIEEYLLPGFSVFDAKGRIDTSVWLRDHLSIAQSEHHHSNRLFDKVRNNRLIVCEDGELRTPMSVYQPGSKLAKDVLGNQAAFPDMEATYADDSERWLEFFRQLNMPVEPQLDDVVKYVETLAADTCDKDKIKSIQRVYEFIKNRVDAELQEISDELSVALGELAEIRWIPVRQEAGDLLCFANPKETYARSREVYFPRFGQLIASQAYISTLKPEPKQQVCKAMGFPVKPPLDLVVAHFREVLAVCVNLDMMPNEKVLIKALGEIYRFFGGKTPKIADDIDDAAEESEGKDTIIDLAASFADIPCLWDQDKQLFWKPKHVFTDKVRYMEPWRCSIRSKNEYIERGYTALGRKQEPSIDDWLEVLEEISDSGLPIEDQKHATVIKEIIIRIVGELNHTKKCDDSVLVPTRDGRMLEAKAVFLADAHWYESMLDDWNIPILANSVSGIPGIQPALAIPSLAESVDERLTETPIDSGLENERQECARLEKLLRSSEFIIGLRRLLRHEGHEVSEESLSYLYSIRVRCVKTIQIGLYLKANDTERFLGEDKTAFYWKHDTSEAMLAENRGRYFCDDLAELLKRSLQENLLSNLAPLVRMLECDPSEVSTVLDDLKIRQYQFEPEEDIGDEDDDATDFQEFPDDETATQAESDETEELESNTQYNEPDSDVPEDKDAAFDDDSDDENSEDDELTDDESPSANSESVNTGQSSLPRSDSTATRTQRESSGQPGKHSTRGSRGGHGHFPTSRAGSSGSDNTHEDMEKGSSSGTKGDTTSSTASRNRPNGQRRLVSYVSHGTVPDDRERSSSGSGNKRIQIGDEAVRIVIEHEQKKGRNACSMAQANKGYDVISEGNDGARYIEVKGTEAAWGERGVTMSHPQFFYGREHPDREHWLYVVENVFSQNPTLHKIRCPSEEVTHFVFDGEWRQVAESVQITESENSSPSPGDEVLVDGLVVGVVKFISASGKLPPLVIYQDLNDNEQKKLLTQLSIRKREA